MAGHAPIICFVQANGAFIFGFFLGIPIRYKSIRDEYACTDQSWLFSLASPNYGFYPKVYHLKKDKLHIAVNFGYEQLAFGKKLENQADLLLNLEDLNKSYSNLGYAYEADS